MLPSNLLRDFPEQLPEPANYFQGIGASQRPRSNNLVCFLRTSRASLQQKHFANRSHHRHVLILVLETAGSVIADGTEHRLQSGQAYYVKPFQFHHYLNLADDALRWLFFTFDLDEGADALAPISDQQLQPGPEELLLWRSIVDCASQAQKGLQAGALPRLDTLLDRLSQQHKHILPKTRQSSWIAKAEGLIIQSVETGWTVEAIGQKLGVSGRHLRSLFEAEMGISIREYRANYQLHRALSLMRDPKLPLGRIAELSGFNSQAVFNRFIKRQTGQPPSGLRKESSQM